MPEKSTVDQIRARFDADVERFSDLSLGNPAQVDQKLSLELIASAAAALTPEARTLLDVGCGAGNYSLTILSALPNLDVTLLDLSRPMLDRAAERVISWGARSQRALQGDIREVEIGQDSYDVIVAGAVLHHLRTDAEWEAVYAKLYAALRPGGWLYIYDLVEQETPALQALMARRYAEYLTGIGGEAYREKVLGWIDMEDTPRPLTYQVRVMRHVGFATIEVLHKVLGFAAFCGGKV